MHPFFDELRDPNTRLPNGRPLPPLFNFRSQGKKLILGMSNISLSAHTLLKQPSVCLKGPLLRICLFAGFLFNGLCRGGRHSSGCSSPTYSGARKEAELVHGVACLALGDAIILYSPRILSSSVTFSLFSSLKFLFLFLFLRCVELQKKACRMLEPCLAVIWFLSREI